MDIVWTNTQLAAQLTPGSLVTTWNRTGNCWSTSVFLKAPAAKGGGWGAGAANFVVHPADGFVVESVGTNFTWVE